MKPTARFTLTATLILLGVCGQASAQYMKITTDNPTDNTRLRPSGTTVLTITLDTNHDRDGSLQTCNSHASACGASGSTQRLDMFNYTLAFRAVGGTVQWGTFSAADAAYTTFIPQIQNDTEVEVNQIRGAGITPPGLTTLGTIPVAIVAGVPTIVPQIGPGALNPFGFGCGFGTDCEGYLNPNTYVLGNPSDPCGVTSGVPGDWFDFDGVTAGPSETPPEIVAPANATAVEGAPMTPIEATATDPDASRTLTITQSGMPADLTFTTDSPGPSPRHASVSGTPGFDDANVPPAGLGFYRIAFTVSDGTDFGVATAVTALIISNTNRAPTLNPIPNVTLCGGAVVDQGISGSDPDGDALAFSKVAGPSFMTVATTGLATGNVHLAPPVTVRSGSFSATVRVDDNNFGIADGSFTITISCTNRCPQANPGGPYSGIVGVAVHFDGSASSDPDGDPLTYAWDLGGVPAVGSKVSHTFATAGLYSVTLAVTDNGNGDPTQACSANATTTATITDACDATIFNGYDTIRLGSGKPYWFGYIQPTSSCYANTDVVTSSFVMKDAGRQISAAPSKTTVGGDKSGDGIQEIKVSFTKDDLRALFTGTGLPNGHSTVTVVIEANLVTGGKLSGSTQLDVVNNGSFTISEVAPNPLNPSATLTYTTRRAGAVRIDMFDIQGRLVRHLVDEPSLSAGLHEATIDGLGQHGEKLPSGVYYIRGVSSEGVFQHLITILK